MAGQKQAPPSDATTRRAIAWGGVAFAVIAILGLFYVPAARIVWLVLLVFAVASIPQALFAGRARRRKERDGRR